MDRTHECMKTEYLVVPWITRPRGWKKKLGHPRKWWTDREARDGNTAYFMKCRKRTQ